MRVRKLIGVGRIFLYRDRAPHYTQSFSPKNDNVVMCGKKANRPDIEPIPYPTHT